MKGVNLRKIGAIVAGATILASSVAFAGLTYENLELVDANGQPVAKVVLGSGSAPSDGVVAATIAAKLASVAYKKQTLTAAVPNDATCSVSGGNGSTAGKCPVTDESVTLELTVPGTTNSGIYEFTTLVADYVDKKLGNRFNLGNDDLYDISGNSESDIEEANPFDTEGGDSLLGDEDILGIRGSDFAPFATTTVTDTSSGDQYSEYQSAWVKGATEFVEADSTVEANLNTVALQYKFDDTKHVGIPVCTEDKGNDKNWADCTDTSGENNPSAATVKHRVKIQFLGSEWVITDLVPVTGSAATNEDDVFAGGSATLAKESVYGIVNVGESLKSKDGQISVRLDDISTLEGEKPAIVSFLDANGNVISGGNDQIAPGSTVKKTIGGNTYKVRVYQTAPGYTFGAKWVEMALLENELELKDDDAIDSQTINEDWTVRVLWKDKDGGASGDDGEADALRGFLVYRTAFGDALMANQGVNVVESPVAYKLNYLGLDLTSSDYDALKYSTGGTVSLSLENGDTISLAANSYIKVSSGVDEAFKVVGTDSLDPAPSVTGKAKEFYYLLEAATPTGGNSADDAEVGDIIMKKSGSTKYVAVLPPVTAGTSAVTGGMPFVEYKTAGTGADDVDGGAIVIDGSTLPATATFFLAEDMGKVETASGSDDHAVDFLSVYYDTGDSKFYSVADDKDDSVTFEYETDMADSELANLGYTDEPDQKDYQEGKFVSPRGSKFDSMSSTSVQFKVAKKLANAKYSFSTVAAANSSASTTQLVMKEGDEKKVGDVTVKVKSIDETLGACSVSGGTGASGSCTVSKDQISAVIMPNNAGSVEAVVPFAVNPKGLVVLDKDAGAVSTGTLITVGGDKVNSVTASAMAGSGIDFASTPVVVKAVGSKIIVAGLTAQDTMAAGDQFLANVQ
jgi:hypothetical protein